MTDPQTGKRKSSKAGRNRDKCARYKLSGRRERNKTVRVAKSSGYATAIEYARAHAIGLWAEKRLAWLLAKAAK